MTQKDAVFAAVTSILSSDSIVFTPSSTNVASLLTRPIRARINDVLVSQFANGTIDISEDARSKLSDTTALKAYISGLVSNWVRKDPRLNGGAVIATSTSSTTGVSNNVLKKDAQLQALRKLHSAQLDTGKQLEIQAHIDRRVAELKQQ